MAILTSDRELIIAPYHAASYNASMPLQASFKNRSKRSRRRRAKTNRPVGLWNAGQSCHLGATITILSCIPLFRDWVMKNVSDDDSSRSILKHYLLEAAYPKEGHNPLDPRPALRTLDTSGWHSRHAQDALETMQRIFQILGVDAWTNFSPSCGVASCLSQDEHGIAIGRAGKFCLQQENRRQGDSPFHLISSLAHFCHVCHRKSETRFQTTPIISLPVTNKPTRISSLLSQALVNEEIVVMRCESCGGDTTHTLLPDVYRWPNVLLLHLQRAMFGSRGVTVNDGNILVTETLECHGGRYGDKCKSTVAKYHLRGVIRHWGLASGYRSHFDAIIGTTTNDPCNGLRGIGSCRTWWLVNDDRVTETTKLEACDPRAAYILVYDKEM